MADSRRPHPHQCRRPPHRAPRPLRQPPRRQVPRPGAQAGAQRRGLRRVEVRPGRDGDRGAQRRGRPPQGGVRHGAAEPRRGAARLLRRPRACEGHGRRRRAGLDELPLVPHLHGPHVLQRRHRPVERAACGPTTTGTSTSGAAPTPAASSPWPCRRSGAPRRPPPRCGARRPRAATPSASPRTPRRSATPASTTTTGTRCGRRASTPARCCRSTWAASGRLSIPAVDSPPDVMITLQPMNIQSAAADLLWSRVIKTYPDLRIALSEGGTGWIPYFLDRVDRTYEMHHAWTLQDFGGRLPSEVFREHFLTCFISDAGRRRAAPQDRHRQHVLGGRLPAQRLDVAHRPGGAGRGVRGQRRARRRGAQDHARERHALVLVRPLRPRAEGGGDRRRAARPRPPATTCRSWPGAPGRAPPTRSSRASARRARRAVAAGR